MPEIQFALTSGFDLLTFFGDLLRTMAKAYCPRVYEDFELIFKFGGGLTVLFEFHLSISMSSNSTNFVLGFRLLHGFRICIYLVKPGIGF